MSNSTPLPVDYNVWLGQWHQWADEAVNKGWLVRTTDRFPGVNFMADDRLGTWRLLDGRLVELSAVTFPDLGRGFGGDHVRYVGVTLSTGPEGEREGDLAASFADLESMLGLA